jgi:hypothetical protein
MKKKNKKENLLGNVATYVFGMNSVAFGSNILKNSNVGFFGCQGMTKPSKNGKVDKKDLDKESTICVMMFLNSESLDKVIKSLEATKKKMVKKELQNSKKGYKLSIVRT